MGSNDPKRNQEHYMDLTTYSALRHIDEETERFNKLLKIIKGICDIAGFSIENRIVLKDERTGKIWR